MGGIIDAIRKYARKSEEIEWHKPANNEFYELMSKIFKYDPNQTHIAQMHYTAWASLNRITLDEALKWLQENAKDLGNGWYELSNKAWRDEHGAPGD